MARSFHHLTRFTHDLSTHTIQKNSLNHFIQFANWVIGDNVPVAITALLQKYFDKPLQGDDKVFDVIATLDDGIWLLVASTVVQFVVGSAILALCETALSQEEARRDGKKIDSSSK